MNHGHVAAGAGIKIPGLFHLLPFPSFSITPPSLSLSASPSLMDTLHGVGALGTLGEAEVTTRLLSVPPAPPPPPPPSLSPSHHHEHEHAGSLSLAQAGKLSSRRLSSLTNYSHPSLPSLGIEGRVGGEEDGEGSEDREGEEEGGKGGVFCVFFVLVLKDYVFSFSLSQTPLLSPLQHCYPLINNIIINITIIIGIARSK